jgi:hypothetical protein
MIIFAVVLVVVLVIIGTYLFKNASNKDEGNKPGA